MSEKRFNTDELVNIFNNHSVDRPYYFGFDVVNAIIARLRAADALISAIREESPLSANVRKAIADYEEKEFPK